MAVDAKLGEAFVEIVARMDRFEKELQSARKATEQSSRQMQSSLDGIRSRSEAVTQSMVGLKTVIAAVVSGGLSVFVQRMIAAGDEIAKTAATLGLTGERLQELRHAAGLAGVTQETLTNALQRFSRGMGDSSEEVSSFQRALGRLGLRMDDLRRLSLDEQIKLVSDRLSQMADVTQRNNIAFELFGRTGVRAVNFLSSGRSEIERFAGEARRLGLVLSEDTLKKAEEANDEFDRIGSALRAAGINIAVGFLPAIQSIRELVTDQSFQTGVRNIAAGIGDLIKLLVENKDKVIIAATAFAGLKVGAALGGATLGRQGAVAGGFLGMVAGMVAGAELATSEIDRLTREVDGLVRRRDELARKIVSATTPQDVVALTSQYEAVQREIAAKRGAISELRRQVEGDLSQPLRVTVNRPPQTIFPEIDLALKDLRFKRALLANEFAGFAEGFPEMLKSLRLPGVDVMAVLRGGAAGLTGQLHELHDAMLDVQAAQLRVDIATPIEKMNRELERARLLLDAGKILLEEFNAKAIQLQFPQLTQFLQQAGDVRYQIDQLVVGSLNNLSTSFRDVVSGSKSLGDALRQFAIQGSAAISEMIFRMVVLQTIARILRSTLTGFFGGGGGENIVLDPSNFGLITDVFHSGGTVGAAGARKRIVHPGLFANAPRYHGGIDYVGGERPAILKVGERVIPAGASTSAPAQQITVRMAIDLSGHMTKEEVAGIARAAAAQGVKEAVAIANAGAPSRQQRFQLLGV